ncbi:AbrB/MazE/SpoVT family DNA-binding domain-containing protein [Candidatus Micrarchaeota archaeon]|nr:AbrB/MazE/SpoVT family DNA-binding domain-containing protein [Candidatus Micrarchaeota archaeon]
MYYFNRRIGPKGTVVIPSDLREMFGLKAGSEIVLGADSEGIRIKPGKTPEEFVKAFCSIVPESRKTKNKIDINKLHEDEILERHGL